MWDARHPLLWLACPLKYEWTSMTHRISSKLRLLTYLVEFYFQFNEVTSKSRIVVPKVSTLRTLFDPWTESNIFLLIQIAFRNHIDCHFKFQNLKLRYTFTWWRSVEAKIWSFSLTLKSMRGHFLGSWLTLEDKFVQKGRCQDNRHVSLCSSWSFLVNADNPIPIW